MNQFCVFYGFSEQYVHFVHKSEIQNLHWEKSMLSTSNEKHSTQFYTKSWTCVQILNKYLEWTLVVEFWVEPAFWTIYQYHFCSDSCWVQSFFIQYTMIFWGLHFYRPQTKFAKVMFSQVSVCPRGGVPGQVPPGRCTPRQVHPQADTLPQAGTPPRYTPRPQCMLGYCQQAGGTHPTGMHSCLR